MSLNSKIICPYCFEEHQLKNLEFKCTYQKCKTAGNKDENYFPAGSKAHLSTYPVSAVCPECGKTTYKIVCPECKNPLPESTLTGKDMIISIVGGTGTGKSCYVGVIIKEFIERVAPAFGGTFIGFDDTTKRYNRDFGSILYGAKPMTLDRTQVNPSSYKPLIYTLSLKHKGLFKNTIDSFTFVFFDTAGEHFSDEETMRTINSYICKSSGIIFLLDPTNIGAVREQLSDDTLKGASNTDWSTVAHADDIMSRVCEMIRQENNLSSQTTIDVPVAAVFSKFDAIESIIPEGSTILSPSPHCSQGKFLMSDAQNVNMEVTSLLKEWGENSFIAEVDVNYPNHAFFVASAFGLHNNPTKQEGSGEYRAIQRPRPHRIEDAMLWIMMKNGAIQSTNK